MARHIKSEPSAVRSSGFTLLETLVVVAILMIVMGGVFSQINKLQKVYRTEGTKVDASQESRNMLDQIARDLHQAGFPGANLFGPGILNAPTANDSRAAVGLVRVAPGELWFEGDVDNDGAVDVVHYLLLDSAGNAAAGAGNCPCTLQRSQVLKQNGTAPLAQPPTYTSALNNVINSGGVGAANAPLFLTGNTMGNANNTLYTAYKNPFIFTALDATGTAVPMPVDVTNPTSLANVRQVLININTLPLQEDTDARFRPPVTMTLTAKLNN